MRHCSRVLLYSHITSAQASSLRSTCCHHGASDLQSSAVYFGIDAEDLSGAQQRYSELDSLIRKVLWLRALNTGGQVYADKQLACRDRFVQVCLLAQRQDGHAGPPDMDLASQVGPAAPQHLPDSISWLCLCSQTLVSVQQMKHCKLVHEDVAVPIWTVGP